MLTELFKNPRFSPPPNLHTYILLTALDNAWDGDSRPFIFFLSLVFARLEMRHTRNFGVVILNYAYWTF